MWLGVRAQGHRPGRLQGGGSAVALGEDALRGSAACGRAVFAADSLPPALKPQSQRMEA